MRQRYAIMSMRTDSAFHMRTNDSWFAQLCAWGGFFVYDTRDRVEVVA